MQTGALLVGGSRLSLLTVGLGLLVACSGSGSSSDTTSPSTADPTSAPSSTQTPPATSTTTDQTPDQTTSGTSAATCSPTPAVLAVAKKFSEVTRVSLIGGCGQLSAATTLPPGALGSPSATKAVAVCQALSKVAYVGAVYGVSVVGNDGHELAASTKDERHCL